MGIVLADQRPLAADSAAERFRRRLTQVFRSYLTIRTERAVPKTVLRRSTHELARCRRLLQVREFQVDERNRRRRPAAEAGKQR
jgi:hypothetical protein